MPKTPPKEPKPAAPPSTPSMGTRILEELSKLNHKVDSLLECKKERAPARRPGASRSRNIFGEDEEE